MVEFEQYIQKLKEKGWEDGLDIDIADHLRRKGYSLSHALYVKAVLAAEIGREDGPLAGMELKHDAYEMTILGRVIDRIIDENL